MFKTASSEDSAQMTHGSFSAETILDNLGDDDWYAGEVEEERTISYESECKNCISVGDYLPYGIRFYYADNSMIRMKDIGEKRRILLLGVVGSFTPYCWNRHLFRVINKCRYYQERGIDYICCISTNDAATQTAWSEYLGCEQTVFMLADVTKLFTQHIGMDIVLPWLDNNIRSKRYIIYAENMRVIKLIVAANDGPNLKWNCEHLLNKEEDDDEKDEDSSDSWI